MGSEMKDELSLFLSRIKPNSSLLSLGETQAKSGIIEPILRLLEWDTSIASSEVILEYPVEQGRIDYCLQATTSTRVFLEAKKPAEDLDDHQDQLLEYSFRVGVKLAVLSNGVTWAFYLPLSEGKWEHRRFYTVDIIEQDANEAASRLIDFLGRQNVTSGDAVKHATQLLESKRRSDIINNSIPDAWNRIISEPDTSLLNLLAERTGKICGFQPSQNDLIEFFNQKSDTFLVSPEDDSLEPPASVTSASQRTTARVVAREHISISDSGKVLQTDLMYEIVRALQTFGGRAQKEQVEKHIYSKHERIFKLPYYQQLVSTGVPRWQHNIAWAKENAKKQEFVKWPSESGRGIWELTTKGKNTKV